MERESKSTGTGDRRNMFVSQSSVDSCVDNDINITSKLDLSKPHTDPAPAPWWWYTDWDRLGFVFKLAYIITLYYIAQLSSAHKTNTEILLKISEEGPSWLQDHDGSIESIFW